MTVSLPNAINLHDAAHTTDPLALERIGAPSSLTLKDAGNLPLTTRSASFLSSSGTANSGLAYSFPAAVDQSSDSKVLIWGFQFNAPNRIQVHNVANNGIIARLYSSVGNYRDYVIGGNDTVAGSSQGGVLAMAIDAKAPDFTETGTFDITNVTGYGFATRRFNMSASNNTWAFVVRAYLFDTTKDGDLPTFVGANAHFSELTDLVLGSDYTTKIHTFVSRAGETYTLVCPWQIGDGGTTTTTFDATDATVLSPSNNDPGDPRYQLSTDAMRVYLSLGASDTVTLSGNYVWGTAADWDCDSAVGATVTLNGSYYGMGNMTVGSDVTCNGGNFTLNGYLIDNGADLEGAVVRGPVRLLGNRDLTGLVADKVVLEAGGNYNFTRCLIGEVENVSGAAAVIVSDSSIDTLTETSGTISLQDAFLSFADMDSWSVYATAADQDANTNPIGTGVLGDTYPFTYVQGQTFYVRLVSGTSTIMESVTPVAAGETPISLSVEALLVAVPSTTKNLVWQDTEDYAAGSKGNSVDSASRLVKGLY